MKVFEPNRNKYRKHAAKNNYNQKCPFCDAKVIKKQSIKNLETRYWMVLVNIYPYLDGNVMIVPKRHVVGIKELKKEEWDELRDAVIKTQSKLEKIFDTKSFNIGINIGREAGSSIDHMHWEIVPRKNKIENYLNIFADIQIITKFPKVLKKEIENLK